MIKVNKNNLFLLDQIVRKNFASKYKGSIIGVFWSFLRPLFIMIILTIIFSSMFSMNIENYPVYFMSGRGIYDFFSAGVGVTMMSLSGNKNILKKTPVPKHIFILGGVISELINYLITLIIFLGVMFVTNAEFHIGTMLLSVIPIFSLIMLISGIGFILSILSVYYMDIQHLWVVINTGLMYACAIFYPIEVIPESFRRYVILNPLFWIIDQFRCLMVYGTIPDLLNIVNTLLISAIILILGIIVFKKFEKKVTMKL